MADCKVGDVIEWAHFYPLGQKIDSISSLLNIKDYIPMDKLVGQPWALPESIAAPKACVYFALSRTTNFRGFPTITDQYITDDFGRAVFDLPQAARDLATAKLLNFVSEQDACWCKTLFRVEPRPRLATAQPSSCCQVLKVPGIGAALDYSQNFIPAAYVKQWQTRAKLKPANGDPPAPYTVDIRKCKGGPLDIRLYFEPTTGKNKRFHYYVLVGAQRRLPGKFVWPIKASFMDALWKRIEAVLDCSKTLGSSGLVFLDGSQDGRVRVGCPVDWSDVVHTGKMLWNWDDGPGCITQSDCRPWNSVCCGADSCENRPPVHCRTLEQLDSLLEGLFSAFIPAVEDLTCPSCCTSSCSFCVGTDHYPGCLGIGEPSFDTDPASNSWPWRVTLTAATVVPDACLEPLAAALAGCVYQVAAGIDPFIGDASWALTLNGESTSCVKSYTVISIYSDSANPFTFKSTVRPCSGNGQANIKYSCHFIPAIDPP